MKFLRHGYQDFDPEQLQFSVLHRNPQENYPLHEHEFVELVIITGGSGTHFTDTISYTVKPGDVYIIRPGIRHGYKDVNNLTLTNVLYNANNLMTPLADVGTMAGFHALFKIEPHFIASTDSRLLLNTEQIDKALEIISRIDAEIKEHQPGYILFSKIYFIELIGFLSRCYNVDATRINPDVARIAEVISYIEQNFTEEITLDELTSKARLSKSHFLNIFKKSTHTTPLLYQKTLRMEKACSLLAQTKLSISEIGYRCGYTDSNYFSRQFKSVVKTSPKQYRQNKSNTRI